MRAGWFQSFIFSSPTRVASIDGYVVIDMLYTVKGMQYVDVFNVRSNSCIWNIHVSPTEVEAWQTKP